MAEFAVFHEAVMGVRAFKTSVLLATVQAAAAAVATLGFAACTLDHGTFRAKGPTPFAVAAAATQPFVISEPKSPPGISQTSVVLSQGNKIIAEKKAAHQPGQRFNFGTLADGSYSLAFNWEDRAGTPAYRGQTTVRVAGGRATPATIVVSPIGVTQPVPVVAKLQVTH